jgi:hypothetical protein
LAVVGTPMPRMSDVIMVKKRVTMRLPPASSTSPLPSLRPKPVSVMAPMMIPAEAQAKATPMAFRAPSSKPSAICLKLMRVAFFKAPAMIHVTSPISAA